MTLATYRGGIPGRRRSPIPALTGLNVEQLRRCDERPYRHAKPPDYLSTSEQAAGVGCDGVSATVMLARPICRCFLRTTTRRSTTVWIAEVSGTAHVLSCTPRTIDSRPSSTTRDTPTTSGFSHARAQSFNHSSLLPAPFRSKEFQNVYQQQWRIQGRHAPRWRQL